MVSVDEVRVRAGSLKEDAVALQYAAVALSRRGSHALSKRVAKQAAEWVAQADEMVARAERGKTEEELEQEEAAGRRAFTAPLNPDPVTALAKNPAPEVG